MFNKRFKSSAYAVNHLTSRVTDVEKNQIITAYASADDRIPPIMNLAKRNEYLTIVFYPDPKNLSSSSNGARQFKACFLHHGTLQRRGGARYEIAMGDQIIKTNGLLTAVNTPNYKELIDTALIRSAILFPPYFPVATSTVQKNIESYLEPKSLSMFACVSLFSHKVVASSLHTLAVKKLLQHVVRGEINAIYSMLMAKPKLLLEKATVMDYSEREATFTAYQLALGYSLGFVNPKSADELISLLEHFLQQLPNGRNIMHDQFDEFQQYVNQQEEKTLLL